MTNPLFVSHGMVVFQTPEPITMDTLMDLAHVAIKAKVPANVEITHVAVDYHPHLTDRKWELRISWRRESGDGST
jgi:hypothetical protein